MATPHDDDTEFEDLPGAPPDDSDPAPLEEPELPAADQDDDEADHDDHPATDADDADEDAEYGRKVQKRIAKEVSKRKRIETEFATRQAQYEQYIANLHQRLESVEQRFSAEDAKQSATELEAQLADIKARRKTAWDDGDIDAYHALEDEYLDARMAVQRQTQGAPGTRQAPPVAQPVAQPQQPAALPEPMQTWMVTNKKWFNGDPANSAKVSVANGLFNAMKAEGFEETDPDLYAELDKRLVAAGIKPAPRKAQPTTVAPTRYAGASETSPRKGFTQADMATMRKYGMDPNNPAHRAAYLNRNAPL